MKKSKTKSKSPRRRKIPRLINLGDTAADLQGFMAMMVLTEDDEKAESLLGAFTNTRGENMPVSEILFELASEMAADFTGGRQMLHPNRWPKYLPAPGEATAA